MHEPHNANRALYRIIAFYIGEPRWEDRSPAQFVVWHCTPAIATKIHCLRSGGGLAEATLVVSP
ncbi:MAG: hypothetical protein ACXWIU_09220, partial [Limisphaerales bacterium]